MNDSVFICDGEECIPLAAAIATDVDRSDTEMTPVGADRYPFPEAAVEGTPGFSQPRKCAVIAGQYCEGICLKCGSTDVDLAKKECDKCGGPVPLVRAPDTGKGRIAVFKTMERLRSAAEREKELKKLTGTWHDREPLL